MNEAFCLAVKAFIVNEQEEVLFVQRCKKDVHAPHIWEIPGGRLNSPLENPHDGLLREVVEETGVHVTITLPLMVDHFVRDDGQPITMIIFLCRCAKDEKVVLSDEHQAYKWMAVNKAHKLLVHHFHPCISRYLQFFSHKDLSSCFI